MKFCVGDVVECIIQAKLPPFKTPIGSLYTIVKVQGDTLKFKEEPYSHLNYSAFRFKRIDKDVTYSRISYKIKQLEDRFKARTIKE